MDCDPLCRSMKVENKEMIAKLKIMNCEFPQIKKEINDDGKKVKKINAFIAEIKAPLKLSAENTLKMKRK